MENEEKGFFPKINFKDELEAGENLKKINKRNLEKGNKDLEEIEVLIQELQQEINKQKEKIQNLKDGLKGILKEKDKKSLKEEEKSLKNLEAELKEYLLFKKNLLALLGEGMISNIQISRRKKEIKERILRFRKNLTLRLKERKN